MQYATCSGELWRVISKCPVPYVEGTWWDQLATNKKLKAAAGQEKSIQFDAGRSCKVCLASEI